MNGSNIFETLGQVSSDETGVVFRNFILFVAVCVR